MRPTLVIAVARLSRQMRSLTILGVGLALIAPSTSMALNVTLEAVPGGSSTLLQSVAIGDIGQITATFEPTSLPFSDTHLAQSLVVTSETSYGFDNSGFRIDMSHFRDQRATSQSSGVIVFQVSQPASYSLSGEYSLVGLRFVQLNANLFDLSAGNLLLNSSQGSGQTPNESFVLGGSGGDSSNQFFGSLSGDLIAGNTSGGLDR